MIHNAGRYSKGGRIHQDGHRNCSFAPANYIVGDGFALDKPNKFYVYEYLASDRGTGTIVTYKFDGNSIQIYDGDDNLTDASIEVDKLGDSADGKFDGFAFKDVSLLKENYKVVATEIFD